jgi:DNA repair exonuclease SbcCD ATPase subunit
MNRIETVNAPSNDHGSQRHAHRTQAEADRCPLCGSPISAALRARLDEKLSAQLAKAEQSLRDQFARDQAVAEQRAKAAIEAARRDAGKAAQAQIKALRADQEAVIKQQVEAALEVLEKRVTEAVAAERMKAYSERQKLDAQLQELQRKLQKKTANDLGDEGELDLYSELTREFPMDQIERIKKGVEAVTFESAWFRRGHSAEPS